jgi:hypothetical protein
VTAAGDYVGTHKGQRVPAALGVVGRVAYVDFEELGVERVRVAELPESWH